MTYNMVTESTGESHSFFKMHPLSTEQLMMDYDILYPPSQPYIDIDELEGFLGRESFKHHNAPEILSITAHSNSNSSTHDTHDTHDTHVSSSVSHDSNDRELSHGRHLRNHLKQSRQVENISDFRRKNKSFEKWSDTETKTLISAVNKHGLKWSKIKSDSLFHDILIKRSNVDLKDKWRNTIISDFKNNFSFEELDHLTGPEKWLLLTPAVTQVIDKHNYTIGDWKRLSINTKFDVLKKLGEVEILTIFRSYLNKL